jgi:hypothetical protein
MLEAFHAAVDGTEMHGPLTIVPKAALAEWKKVATGMQTQDGLKAFQILSQNFRRVVLPFSPKWFFGNILEAGFRSLIYGNGPFDYARGVKVLRMLDEHDRKHGTDLGAQFAARTLGGRLYGSRGRDKLHRSAEQFTDGSRIRSVVEGGSKVRQAPGVKQLLDGLGHMQDAVFGFNERLEDSFATAAIGSHVRNEILETSHSIADMLNIGDKAIREYVEKGLTNTNKQHEFAEKLDEVLGRYSRHTSEERWVIQTFMPFWDWYRNAIVFVTKTMPLKHPVKTALLTAVDEQMIDDLRSQGNVGIFSHTDLPAFMRGMPVVDEKGDRINLQHYLPFGVGGDPGGSLER